MLSSPTNSNTWPSHHATMRSATVIAYASISMPIYFPWVSPGDSVEYTLELERTFRPHGHLLLGLDKLAIELVAIAVRFRLRLGGELALDLLFERHGLAER